MEVKGWGRDNAFRIVKMDRKSIETVSLGPFKAGLSCQTCAGQISKVLGSLQSPQKRRFLDVNLKKGTLQISQINLHFLAAQDCTLLAKTF
jgi:hypothetical protein